MSNSISSTNSSKESFTSPASQITKNILLAIVGYRNYNDYTSFSKEVDQYINEIGTTPVEIISGACKGADTLGERYANEHKIKMVIFKPDFNKYKAIMLLLLEIN